MTDTLEAQAPALPKTKGTVVPYLTVDGASKAAAFYIKAFGAEEAFRYPEDENGRTMHIHLYINGGSVMLSDGYPDQGHPALPPQGFQVQLILESGIEALFQRALDAGAEVVTPVQKMFWGDTWGQVRDPFGVTWGMNQTAQA
jgi:PhnB protein